MDAATAAAVPAQGWQGTGKPLSSDASRHGTARRVPYDTGSALLPAVRAGGPNAAGIWCCGIVALCGGQRVGLQEAGQAALNEGMRGNPFGAPPHTIPHAGCPTMDGCTLDDPPSRPWGVGSAPSPLSLLVATPLCVPLRHDVHGAGGAAETGRHWEAPHPLAKIT